MQRGLKITAAVLCVGAAIGLSGCSQSTYPRLPSLSRGVDNLLTPKEQEATIRDLASEQNSAGAAGSAATRE